MRYNRADIESTVKVAKISAVRQDKVLYVFATAYGYTIWPSKPPLSQAYLEITAIGEVKQVLPVRDWNV